MTEKKPIDHLMYILENKSPDIVPAVHDDAFERAIKGPPEEFRKYFNQRCKDHSGFSVRATPYLKMALKNLALALKYCLKALWPRRKL